MQGLARPTATGGSRSHAEGCNSGERTLCHHVDVTMIGSGVAVTALDLAHEICYSGEGLGLVKIRLLSHLFEIR